MNSHVWQIPANPTEFQRRLWAGLLSRGWDIADGHLFKNFGCQIEAGAEFNKTAQEAIRP